MRILTIGCGSIGSVMVREISRALPGAEITVSDNRGVRNLERAVEIHGRRVHYTQLDAFDKEMLITALKEFDLAIGLPPGDIGYQSMEACIQAGVDMVDLSYMPQDPLKLDKAASEVGGVRDSRLRSSSRPEQHLGWTSCIISR